VGVCGVRLPHDSRYSALLDAIAASYIGLGEGRVLAPRAAWDGNATHRCFAISEWHGMRADQGLDLVVVNLANSRAQCRVDLPKSILRGQTFTMVDILGTERFERSG